MSGFDFIGLLGAVCYLAAYALLQLRILTIDSTIVVVLNLLGGVCLIYSLWWNFNLGSFITQIAWFIFTLIGFIRFRIKKLSMQKINIVPPPAFNGQQMPQD